MGPDKIQIVLTAITYIGLPWTVWVTASLFNQRQELALLKQAFKPNLTGQG